MGLRKQPPNSRVCVKQASKQLMKNIKKADAEITKEGAKQIDILYHAAGIALNRYHGWKGLRIERLVGVSQGTYDDCATINKQSSMIEMLWDETGIDLAREGCGRNWWEITYLNSELDDGKEMDNWQIYAMLLGEKKWVASQITASILLSLHRKEGWGPDRLFNFLQEMQAVKLEFGSNPAELRDECNRLTKFAIVDNWYLEKEKKDDK